MRPRAPAEAGKKLSHRERLRGGLRRGIFVLPSLFTTFNLLLGFYAIILADRGAISLACLVIFLAAVTDMLDGRIARMTGTESEFGREYDSLADLTTFGTAPALVSYFWGLQVLGRPGWMIPLFFVVCAAARLARFNVQPAGTDNRAFVGMPAPAAACALCAMLFAFPHLEQVDRRWLTLLLGTILLALLAIGALMVSTFRYPSFKKVDLRRRLSYRAVLLLATLLVVIAIKPEAFFLSVGMLYTLPPPLAWLWGRLGRGPASPEPAPAPAMPTEES